MSVEVVTIVLASDRAVRVTGVVQRVDERFIVLVVDGEERRFNRSTGFEMPVGGSWGAWRLAGKDLRRSKSW